MADFQKIIDQLEAFYGWPEPPKITDPFEMVVFENITYLVNDDQREAVFEDLRSRVGVTPTGILSASTELLCEVAKPGGMDVEGRVEKLRASAQLVLRSFHGDLKNVLKLPLKQATKSLNKFPGIGDPRAEKILLFARTHPVLALESNGLRALFRLGFGGDHKNYSLAYKSAQNAVRDQLKPDCDWLIGVHQLLRRHGQELCQRTDPVCTQCPLNKVCRYFLTTN
jgi:endonuclease III